MKTRSRGGCSACLQQHKKCDESRPSCARCCRLAIDCDYTTQIRWFHGPQLPRAPRRRRQNQQHRGHVSKTTTSTLSPTQDQQLPIQWTDRGDNAPPIPDSDLGRCEISPCPNDDNHLESPRREELEPHIEMQLEFIQSSLQPGPLSPRRLVEESRSDNDFDARDCSRDFENDSSRHEDSDAIAGSFDEIIYSNNVEDLAGNIVSERTPTSITNYVSLFGLIEGDLGSIFFNSRDQYRAYLYFVQSVALIIPGWGTGARNGYKQVAQLALSSPVLLDTLVSVSSVYMYLRGMVPQSVALRRQSQALSSLRRGINTLTASEDARAQDTACLKRDLLATILLQVTVEMANGTSVIQTHLAYALKLFQDLGYDRYRPTSSIGVVLVQRMSYIDVISSIFCQRRPLLPHNFWFFEETEEYKVDEMTPSFEETTGCPLWVTSIMGAICHLVADLEDGVSEDVVFLRALELESALTASAQRHFGLGLGFYVDVDESPYLRTVCECFYWSAVIILQRRVFKDPRDSRRIQFCLTRLVDLLESLPLGCGPDTQLSLPLYVAAHVATGQHHRDRLRSKNLCLAQIYPLKTRTTLAAAFEDIWAAFDSQGADDSFDAATELDPMKDNALFVC